MLRVMIWEFGKLVRLRSMQAGLIIALVLPLLWANAPGLRQLVSKDFSFASGWQLPALSLVTGMEYLFPFLVAIASAEILGSEVATGTLKSLLLRPSPRMRLLGAKLLIVLVYPLILVFTSLLGSVLVGIPFGLGGGFYGTGFDQTAFMPGPEALTPAKAFTEIFRSHVLAAITLWPIATLSFLFSVVFLNTTTAALGAVSTIFLMRLFVVFPAIQFFLLTTYLNLYTYSGRDVVAQQLGRPMGEVLPIGIALLIIYTVGFAGLALLIFERKDI